MAIDSEGLKIFIRSSFYEGELPHFYNQADFPELKLISEKWKDIRDELFDYEKKIGLKGINTYSPPELSNDQGWSNIYLSNFMWKFYKNRRNFPLTCEILDKVSSLSFAGFSVLMPNSTISPHYGDTNGIIRCHLGLVIPEPYPICGIKVANSERGWNEGEFTVFTEAHLHTTWNKSSKKRYILVLDLIHPDYIDRKLEICAKVLSAQTYNFFESRIKILEKIPFKKLKFIHYPLYLLWVTYLKLQNYFDKVFKT